MLWKGAVLIDGLEAETLDVGEKSSPPLMKLLGSASTFSFLASSSVSRFLLYIIYGLNCLTLVMERFLLKLFSAVGPLPAFTIELKLSNAVVSSTTLTFPSL